MNEIKKSNGSPRFVLDMTDFQGLLQNAALVGGAAAVTYIVQNIGQVDFGTMTPVVIPVVSVMLDTLIKWFNSNKVD